MGHKARTSLAKSFQETNGDWALSFEFRQIKLMAEVGERQGCVYMCASIASIGASYRNVVSLNPFAG